jgi:hypothetical protein
VHHQRVNALRFLTKHARRGGIDRRGEGAFSLRLVDGRVRRRVDDNLGPDVAQHAADRIWIGKVQG